MSLCLGDEVTNRIGAYVSGGRALTLAHRHDIRVGKAAALVLKRLVPDKTKQLELLIMLYPCYWRWSTEIVLKAIVANIDQLLAGDSMQRSQIVKGAYDSMILTMENYHVVGF